MMSEDYSKLIPTGKCLCGLPVYDYPEMIGKRRHSDPIPGGHLGNNTAEGWAQMRHENAERIMRDRLHRKPTEDEIQLQMDLNAKVGERLTRGIDMKPICEIDFSQAMREEYGISR